MNRGLLTVFFILILHGGIQVQDVNYFHQIELMENEILDSKKRYFSSGRAQNEIVLIDYFQQADTNYYRITSSINTLEILARKPCAYIFEQNLMTYIFYDDSIKITDTLKLGKAFVKSLKALQLPQRAINWKENAYYDCFLFYEWTTIFDPFIIEYRYYKGSFVGQKFQDKRYYKRIRPKCILTGKYEDKCDCR